MARKRARLTNTRKELNYGIYEMYQDYSLRGDELEHPVLEKDEWKEILYFVFEGWWEKLIKDLMVFKVPCFLGEIYIKEKIVPNSGYIDWPMSKKKKKTVYSYNPDGRKFGIFWRNKHARLNAIKVYNFEAYHGDFYDTDSFVGKMGLRNWIRKCRKDPYLKSFRAYID
jgi:hypothetical protein